MLTDVVLGTSEIVGEGGAAQLVGPEEAEVSGHLPGDGGREALEEALRPLKGPDGPHHRPHRPAGAERLRERQRLIQHMHTHTQNSEPFLNSSWGPHTDSLLYAYHVKLHQSQLSNNVTL